MEESTDDGRFPASELIQENATDQEPHEDGQQPVRNLEDLAGQSLTSLSVTIRDGKPGPKRAPGPRRDR